MKKTYINPEMEVVKIETMTVVAASLQKGEGTISSKNEWDAREYDPFWDDEEW